MAKENLRYSDEPQALQETPANDTGQTDKGLRNIPVSTAGEPAREAKPANKGRKILQDFLGGDYLSRGLNTGNLFFIIYLALLAMIFIGNTYYSEKKIKRIERTKNELKELHYQYITTKSDLMLQGRQSEIAKRALTYGLKATTMPPYRILYSGDMLKPKNK